MYVLVWGNLFYNIENKIKRKTNIGGQHFFKA